MIEIWYLVLTLNTMSGVEINTIPMKNEIECEISGKKFKAINKSNRYPDFNYACVKGID